MGIHTVIGVVGRRVIVQPSKLDAGMITITVLGADRQHLCAVTLTPDAAAVMSQALSLEAVAAEGAKEFTTLTVREPKSWFEVNQAARG